MFENCIETVSILYAIIFGADGACVRLSTSSILTALAAFMVLVVVAQFIARKLWGKLTKPRVMQEDDVRDQPSSQPYSDDPNYRDSAIRTTKR